MKWRRFRQRCYMLQKCQQWKKKGEEDHQSLWHKNVFLFVNFFSLWYITNNGVFWRIWNHLRRKILDPQLTSTHWLLSKVLCLPLIIPWYASFEYPFTLKIMIFAALTSKKKTIENRLSNFIANPWKSLEICIT